MTLHGIHLVHEVAAHGCSRAEIIFRELFRSQVQFINL